jgi:hypothetical protein
VWRCCFFRLMTSLLRFVCKVGAGFSIILLKSSVHVPSIGSLSLENSCQVAETSKPGRHSTLELVCGKKQMPRYACNASVFPQPRFELSTRVFNSTRAFFGLLLLLFCLMMMKRSSCHLKQTLKAVLSSVLITMPYRRL